MHSSNDNIENYNYTSNVNITTTTGSSNNNNNISSECQVEPHQQPQSLRSCEIIKSKKTNVH